jgi:hypothetical protein
MRLRTRLRRLQRLRRWLSRVRWVSRLWRGLPRLQIWRLPLRRWRVRLWRWRVRLRRRDLGLGRRVLLVVGRLLPLVLDLEHLAITLTRRIMPGLTGFDPAKDSVCSASQMVGASGARIANLSRNASAQG